MEKMYEKLIGANVTSVFVERDFQHYAVLGTDRGYFKIDLDGDCCSESFVGDVLKADSGKIISVEEMEVQEGEVPKRKPRQEDDVLFGLRIHLEPVDTKFGEESRLIVFAFRNSSNGYYGGNIDSVEIMGEFNPDSHILIEKVPVSFS